MSTAPTDGRTRWLARVLAQQYGMSLPAVEEVLGEEKHAQQLSDFMQADGPPSVIFFKQARDTYNDDGEPIEGIGAPSPPAARRAPLPAARHGSPPTRGPDALLRSAPPRFPSGGALHHEWGGRPPKGKGRLLYARQRGLGGLARHRGAGDCLRRRRAVGARDAAGEHERAVHAAGDAGLGLVGAHDHRGGERRVLWDARQVPPHAERRRQLSAGRLHAAQAREDVRHREQGGGAQPRRCRARDRDDVRVGRRGLVQGDGAAALRVGRQPAGERRRGARDGARVLAHAHGQVQLDHRAAQGPRLQGAPRPLPPSRHAAHGACRPAPATLAMLSLWLLWAARGAWRREASPRQSVPAGGRRVAGPTLLLLLLLLLLRCRHSPRPLSLRNPTRVRAADVVPARVRVRGRWCWAC